MWIAYSRGQGSITSIANLLEGTLSRKSFENIVIGLNIE